MYHQKTIRISLCVIHVDLEQYWKEYGCHGKGAMVALCVLCAGGFFCLYLLTLIDRHSMWVCLYPWKMRSLSEINSVECSCSSSHSCDSRSWIYLILFLEKKKWRNQLICFGCCGNRPPNQLDEYVALKLIRKLWNMESSPGKKELCRQHYH